MKNQTQPINLPGLGLTGRFRLVASGGKRGRVVLAEFDNLILDAGLNRLGTGTIASACQVGTGTTTPAAAQTALSAYLVGTTTVQATTTSYVAGPPEYIQIIRTYRFAEGVAAGNLAEVGVGWTSATGSLFSRALILDGGGSPTTITVLSDEVLDVDYTLRVYPPATDRTGSIVLDGVTYNYTIRASLTSTGSGGWLSSGILGGFTSGGNVTLYTGVINALTTGSPAGTQSSIGNATHGTYVNNSLQATSSISIGLAQGNLSGGTRSVSFAFVPGASAICRYQLDFGASVPKDSTRVWTMSFRTSWARRP